MGAFGAVRVVFLSMLDFNVIYSCTAQLEGK